MADTNVDQNGRGTEEALAAAEASPSMPFSEIGSTGLRRFGGTIQEEFDLNLRGPRGVRVFEEMRRNDADIGAVLFAINNITLAADWDVEAVSEEKADVDAADFLKTVLFEDMSHSWRDFLIDAMTSNVYGWAYFEIIFKQRVGTRTDGPSSLYEDGRIGIRKIALRGQESLLRWEFDDEGGLRGMVQRGHGQDWAGRLIPIEKSLLVRTTREKNNPEGMSLLRNAYRAYYIKTNMQEIEVIGAERDMTGTLIIYLPANANKQDHAAARRMGERYKQDDQAYFIMQRLGEKDYQNWDVKSLEAPGKRVVDSDKTITRCSVEITRSVLAQFLTLGATATGSYALSASHMDLFHLAMKGRLDTLEDELNRFLVPKVYAQNDFPGMTGMPKVVHSDLGDIDLGDLTAFLAMMGNIGALSLTPEVVEHLHKRAGLPVPAEVEDEETPEEIAANVFDLPVRNKKPITTAELARRYLEGEDA